MSKLKVLIVVDVQNCFITGGSMGGDLANLDMMQEIADLIKKNDYNVVVFTRDSHPINHKSFGIFPNHCRDTDKESCDELDSEKSDSSFLLIIICKVSGGHLGLLTASSATESFLPNSNIFLSISGEVFMSLAIS